MNNKFQKIRDMVQSCNPTALCIQDEDVPQGSILGPILFLIYVNDINNCTDFASFTKFADDTTLLTSGKTLQDAADKMNTALSQVDTWFQKNKLNLNPSKARYMIFNSKSEETDIYS